MRMRFSIAEAHCRISSSQRRLRMRQRGGRDGASAANSRYALADCVKSRSRRGKRKTERDGGRKREEEKPAVCERTPSESTGIAAHYGRSLLIGPHARDTRFAKAFLPAPRRIHCAKRTRLHHEENEKPPDS